ncbi:MAG: DUF2157 domain-containing protein [Alphaproteobacteria bacterium]|nr:DUF2157 domain-containing protein [Alphaproteobacteria bacterium]
MRPPLYRAQLARDLDEWIAAGLIAPQSRAGILAHVDADRRFGLPAILGLLGGALIVAAILSFIAANWQGLDKLPRLLILFGGLWATTGLAAWAGARRYFAAAEVFLLVAVGTYGAAIWFVGQTYHLSGGVEDGLMLWSLGGLSVAILAASPTVMTVGFLLTIAWIIAGWIAGDDTHLWLFPIACAAALACTLRHAWYVALQAATLAILTWLVASTARLGDLIGLSETASFAALAQITLAAWCGLHLPGAQQDWTVRPLRFWMMIGAVLATLVVSWGYRAPQPETWLPVGVVLLGIVAAVAAVAAYARRLAAIDALIAVAFAALVFALPFLGAPSNRNAIEIPALTVVGLELVWVISLGLRRDDRTAINLGFIGFGLWTIYLYASVFDDFLQGALFFAVGGVLLIALAIGLDRVRRAMIARTGAAS